jgi:hypothetical protein
MLETVGTICAILGFLWGVYALVKSRLIKTVQIRRIYNTRDKDFGKFSHLFKQKIRLELRESPEDVGQWLDDFEHDNKYSDPPLREYLLVAKYDQEVVGFLFFEYSFKTQFLYIDFLGAKGNEGNTDYSELTPPLVKECYKIIKKEMKQCRLILFEVDDEKDPNLTEEQRQDAIAKKRLFGSYILNNHFKNLSLKAFEICIDYYQPPLHNENRKHIIQNLVIIPLDWGPIAEDKTISKQQLVDIMNFLFFEVYDPLSDDRYLGKDYHLTLTSYFNNIINNVPEKIKLKQLTRISYYSRAGHATKLRTVVV